MNKLDRLNPLLEKFIANGPSGCALSVIQRDERLYEGYFGVADLETKKSIEVNTIYRIYSMTKIVTCVAALMLYERGHFLLTDNLEEYLPEFKSIQVFRSLKNGTIETSPASKSIQIKDLFTMTSGITYGGNNTEVERQVSKVMAVVHKEQKQGEQTAVRTLSKALATVPLEFDPGTHWKYGLSHDVLGALIEVITGKTFGEFLKEEIFIPLSMEDTFFKIPEDKKERLCSIYDRAEDGTMTKNTKIDSSSEPMAVFESGGAGLLSTLHDYSRFAHMLAMGGTLDGVRILSKKTIELMASNHLSDALLPDVFWNYENGYGYGLGVRVMINRQVGGSNSSVGEFGWSGLAGTYVFIDPKEELSVVYMQQMLPNFEAYHQPRIRNVVYGALN
ncbi:serine hydrolase domain-containing protein [Aquibacillus rhizosphaerae]|uniref:Serine hydrolase domain-containing protein n=1 Tax=Aquibacillus rhizosphaerae TaxID=3051431 RepID=A0ABT7LB18_9BACI|nr:serine hydrolase domain-containing protein [Aquibacillus sp. LR5S19]MDL4843060.1 serine hydrolase domain-containing protein [Aquibacillus sp. LR5S19]